MSIDIMAVQLNLDKIKPGVSMKSQIKIITIGNCCALFRFADKFFNFKINAILAKYGINICDDHFFKFGFQTI